MKFGFYHKFFLIFLSGVLFVTCPMAQNLSQEDVTYYRKQEREYFTWINSSEALAPAWFKKSIRPDLDSSFIRKDSLRGSPYARIAHCPLILRILALLFLLFPIWAAFRGMVFWETFLLIVFYIPLSYLVAGILKLPFNILLYVFDGGEKKIPGLFIYFLLLVFIVLALLYSVTKKFISNLGSAEERATKVLGSFGVFIAWSGVILTLKDLIKYFLMAFGIKFDI
jgi:hypothetical protein